MTILLLDETLQVNIYFDQRDREFEDKICISVLEECAYEEKLFRAGETNFYLTAEQARQLARALQEAADSSTTLRK